jgi:putative transcriptional regulator
MSGSLRAQLLIASPALTDWFRRTVVLVVEHREDEGAMGVVLNRPSETTVAEAVPDLADTAGSDEPVFIGGPVATEAVVALADFEDPADAGTPVLGSVGTLDPERSDAPVRRMRVYAGYAGWGPGQLEGEIEQDAWILEPAAAEDPFEEGDLWALALARKGGDYAVLATMPPDASLN